jgi:hypothetical protein
MRRISPSTFGLARDLSEALRRFWGLSQIDHVAASSKLGPARAPLLSVPLDASLLARLAAYRTVW